MAIRIRRRELIFTLGGGAAATWPLAARAQQRAMPAVGFLRGGSLTDVPMDRVTAFHRGLKEAGFVESSRRSQDQRTCSEATHYVAQHGQRQGRVAKLDPSLYAEPDEFRPERFIERKYSAFEFLPFGGGHRRCLGAHLSDYEMRIALAVIVTRWELELTAADFDIRHNIATGPKGGVRMRVKGRRNTSMHRGSGG